MRALAIVGVLLIVLGVVSLGFQTVTYYTPERVVNAGPLQIDMQRPHTIVINPIVGIVAVLAGVALAVVGGRTKTT